MFKFPEYSSTDFSNATPAESVCIFSTALLNNFDTFLLVFSDICLNISGIGSYVNFIFDLNMFNAFLISSSSSTLNLYFCDMYFPIKADAINTLKNKVQGEEKCNL